MVSGRGLGSWSRVFGDDCCKRTFAYCEFADAGALIAIGTGSPTLPWPATDNLYVAATRCSARDSRNSEAVTDRQFRLGICESIVAASSGAAMGIFADSRVGAQDVGVGKLADFVVVDMLWNADALLEAVVKETWYGGVKTLGDGNKRTATLYTDFCHG